MPQPLESYSEADVTLVRDNHDGNDEFFALDTDVFENWVRVEHKRNANRDHADNVVWYPSDVVLSVRPHD